MCINLDLLRTRDQYIAVGIAGIAQPFRKHSRRVSNDRPPRFLRLSIDWNVCEVLVILELGRIVSAALHQQGARSRMLTDPCRRLHFRRCEVVLPLLPVIAEQEPW